MDMDGFWDLIERARLAAGPAADQAVRDYDEVGDDPDRDYWDFENIDLQAAFAAELGTGTEIGAGHVDEDDEDDSDDEEFDDEEDVTDPIALALLELLGSLPAAEIAAFDNLFEDVRARADRSDLATAATLIEHGILSDESFDDFKAGLVALGRTTFERAVADPDTLADNPAVREIANARDPRWLGREDMIFVASHAYAAVTGEAEVDFFEFAEAQRPEGEQGSWLGDAQEEEGPTLPLNDEHEVRRRLPRLAEMFYERSMQNRQRALDTLGLQA